MRSEESELERDLGEALRRKLPPPGFASRVIANLPREERRRPPLFGMRMLAARWVAAALTLLVAVTASVTMYRHWQYLERGRAAKEQLISALRITGSKLQVAQERVRSISADRIHDRQTRETEQVP